MSDEDEDEEILDPGAPITVEEFGGDPPNCDACHFETMELKRYEAGFASNYDRKMKRLCSLCASSESGKTLDHPEQFRGQAETIRTICYVGNVILAALKRL